MPVIKPVIEPVKTPVITPASGSCARRRASWLQPGREARGIALVACLLLGLGACPGTAGPGDFSDEQPGPGEQPDPGNQPEPVDGTMVIPPGGTEPQISITSPPRGATLDGDPTVRLEGQATGNVLSLWVNDVEVTPADDGAFSHVMQARHGMNLVIVEAEREEGVREKVVQSFYYATQWLPAGTADLPTQIEEAILGWIGQPIFDDGDAATTDFATVLEKALANIDVAALVPANQRIDNVVGCDHVDIEVKNVTYGAPQVGIDLADGSLAVKVSIPSLVAEVKADLDGAWYNPACAVNVSGKVKATSIDVEATFALSVDQSTLSVTPQSCTADVKGFDIDISGIWGFLTNWLVDKFENGLAQDLEQEIASQLDQQLGAALSKGIADLSIDETIEISPLLGSGPPATLELDSRLSGLVLENAGLRLAMQAAVVAEGPGEHPSLGSIAHDHCGAGPGGALAFTDAASYPLQIAISDDLLNQMLYSVHRGGLLHVTDIGQELADQAAKVGISKLEGSIDALLPPIYNSCAGGDQALLELGDVRVQLAFEMLGKPVQMLVHASISAPVMAEVREESSQMQLHLKVAEEVELQMESKNLASEKTTVYDAVQSMLESMLVPQLLTMLQEQAVSITLPEIDFGTMHASIPAGTTVGLKEARIERRDGYVVMASDIR